MTAIVGSEDDPLTVVARMVLDANLDIGTRLSAANTCLPFLYPRLSASQVNANVHVTKIDSSDLLRRLDERLARIVPAEQLLTIDSAVGGIEVTIVDDEVDAV